MRVLWLLCWLPVLGFSALWKFEDLVQHERRSLLASSQVECAYSVLPRTSALADIVNLTIEQTAKEQFAEWSQDRGEEVIRSEEWWPVYQSANLISLYNCRSEIRNDHGVSYYSGKTFWQQGQTTHELTLEDLFRKESDYRKFLRDYVASDLVIEDPESFVLTDQGLVLLSPISWTDDPHAALVPYAELTSFIDPSGPLQAWTN